MTGITVTVGMTTTTSKSATGCSNSTPSERQWKFIQMEQAKEIMEEELKKKMLRKMAFGNQALATSTPSGNTAASLSSGVSINGKRKLGSSEEAKHDNTKPGALMFQHYSCGKCNRQILYAKGVPSIKCSSCGSQYSLLSDPAKEEVIQEAKKPKVDNKSMADLLPTQRKAVVQEKITC